jgi:glycosyltransferase involved in cell wall biosynthesis
MLSSIRLWSHRKLYDLVMRVAFVHEWFTTFAGSEKVLEQMLRSFPLADVFVLVDFLPDSDCDFLEGRKVSTSFLQRLPFAATKHRQYLPLMPLAVEQFDLSGYDLVISNSHAVAKGVLTGPDQLHICYCHSPMRYAWDLQHRYLKESNLEGGLKSWLTRAVLHYLRLWDVRTSNGVDHFIVNSRFIQRRVQKVYRRDSLVIYPPVNVDAFTLVSTNENFYLTASRLVPYKRMDLIVEAFSKTPDRKLVVIGDGPDLEKVRAKAGPNVQVLGFQPFEVLRDHMQRARGFVFAAEEDFGITPVEAQACGTPVIAFGKGGSLETVLDGVTGVFFGEQSVVAILEALDRFEAMSFDPQRIRAHAEGFGEERFRSEFSAFVTAKLEAFWPGRNSG